MLFLKACPFLLVGAGLAEAVIIRNEWQKKYALVEEPGTGDAEGSSVSTKQEKNKQRKRLGETLNEIFERAVGQDNSLLGKVKGKGRELLDDFDRLSKREKGKVLDELGKQIKERRDVTIEEVKRKAEEVKEKVSKIREKQKKQGAQKGDPLSKIRRLMEMNKEVDELEKIVLLEEIGEALDAMSTSSRQKQGKNKKIKLLFIGDSLSACVGVSDPKDGLVLQKTTAKLLQQATGSDVDWYNSAVVGGTVKEIREKVEGVKSQFLKKVGKDEELVVVIICGLNDYKHFILSLWNPWLAATRGPLAFKEELLCLLKDIRESVVTTHSRVYIPAIPIHLMASDPKFLLSVFPLSFMGWSLNIVWDTQKYNIAFEQQAEGRLYSGETPRNSPDSVFKRHIYYVGEPPETASDQVENDVVAADGVHLNTNGYIIWAKFLAAHILESQREKK